MRDAGEETETVSGDPVLIEVLEAAQRFAAWYAEYLSRDAAGQAAAKSADPAEEELVASKLQHAVFDLMAAVHAMNRHCATAEQRPTISTATRRARLRDDALH